MSNDNLSATKVREPLVRIAKRTQSSVLRSWTIRLVALVLALVVGALSVYLQETVEDCNLACSDETFAVSAY